MLCSNHEKIRPGDRIRWRFWSRKNRTSSKMLAEADTIYNSWYFKGRKPKTFRDMKPGDKILQDDD